MAAITLIHVDKPEAQHLADLCGIRFDLQGAARYCEYAITLKGQGVPGIFIPYELLGAVVAAAAIRYMRAFVGGKRYSLKPDVVFDAFDPEHRTFHDFIKKFRDLHIARPINEFEQSYVTALPGRW